MTKRVKKVLLAEDDQVNRFILCELFSQNGFHVDAVSNGEDAISLANLNEYDVILLDAMLPIYSGVLVTRQIRQSRRNQQTPILMVTGLVDPWEKSKAMRYGVTMYITKPFQEKALLKKIKYVLRKRITS